MDSNPKRYKFSFGKLKTEFNENPSINVPCGRSGHRIVACDKNIYIYGGFSPSVMEELDFPPDVLNETTLFLEIMCFNLLTKVWKRLSSWNTPTEVASTTVKKIGNVMVIHGGTGIPFGQKNSSSTYIKHLSHGNLKKLDSTGEVPPGRYGQASVIDERNNLFYIVGGTSGVNFSLDVHCLNLMTKTWEQLSLLEPKDIPARYRHEIALYDSKIYVFGGGTLFNVFGFKKIPVFNVITKKWSIVHAKGHLTSDGTKSKFPHPRRCHSGVMVPGDEYHDPYFIICGGMAINNSFKDVWSFNFRSEQWCKWSTFLPFKLFFHDAVLTPHGKMVVFGGVVASYDDDISEYRTNAVFSCWAKLPKLSEMAWEALLFYNPSLLKKGSKELRRLGIPLSFVHRIEI